jgi:hypothetical protein
MPSRKKSYRKRGSGHKKRSLRFTPKFVIKERADTIEDTLNETIGRTSHRLPIDVANIIQGYEGAETVYFNVDPIFKQFTLSTTNSLKDGGKTYIRTDGDDLHFDEPYTYFIRVKLIVPYFYNNNNRMTERYVLLVGITNMTHHDIEEQIENYVLEKYGKVVVNDLKNSFIGDKKFKGAISPRISSDTEHSITYPFKIEDYNHNEIIFEKLI